MMSMLAGCEWVTGEIDWKKQEDGARMRIGAPPLAGL
jgi:hypothetical protein